MFVPARQYRYGTAAASSRFTLSQAAVLGWAPDEGGMLVPAPEETPVVDEATRGRWRSRSFPEVVGEVLALFADEGDAELTPDDARRIAKEALTEEAGFTHSEIAPLCKATTSEHRYVLELFHGPTSAFKDLGMAVLARLLQHILRRRNERLKLLVGTSGDTGAAAAHAVRNCENISIAVLYPSRRHSAISAVQERQTLACAQDPRTAIVECMGTSDDLDRPINAAFADASLRETHKLGSVNSVNVVRLIVQAAFYAWAITRLPADAQHATFVVPTGAAGHIAAGALAKQMGLPIGRLVAACNANRTFVDLLAEPHVLDGASPTVTTLAPSMDIKLPYNVERLVFWAALHVDGADPSAEARAVADAMASNGPLRLTPATRTAMRDHLGIEPACASDAAVEDAIRLEFDDTGTLHDPHTACGIAAARGLAGTASHPVVLMACAHASKFPETVLRAVSRCPPARAATAASLLAASASPGAPPPSPLRPTFVFAAGERWFARLRDDVLARLPP